MIVFIISPYKSGSSHVTTIVEELGFGSVVDRNAVVQGVTRKYDIRESYEVNRLNNEIVSYITENSTVSNIFYSDPVKDNLTDDLNSRIDDILQQDNVVIKDPRFLLTFDFWAKRLELKNKKYKAIFVNRNAKSISGSLECDEWSESKLKGPSLFVAERMLDQLKYLKTKYWNNCFIDYDRFKKYPEKHKECINNYLYGDIFNFGLPRLVYFLEYYQQGQELLDLYKNQTPNNSGIWKNVIAIDNQEDADFLILSDKTKEEVKDWNKVIYFGREPSSVTKFKIPENIPKNQRFHHEHGNSTLPSLWWINRSYDEIKGRTTNKTKDFSIIDSGKSLIYGHRKRLRLIDKIDSNIKVDIYGYIYGAIKKLPYRDKREGLDEYKYSLAVENTRTSMYFSEKITDCFLCNTIPFYRGCYNIGKYFPENSFIELDDDDDIAVKQIKDTLSSNFYEEHQEELLEAKRLVMEKYNIWSMIKTKTY